MTVWQRENEPTPIPDPCSATVLRLLSDEQLAAVLRSNLVPREDRRGHHELWLLLAFNADLAERAVDHLRQFLAATEAQKEEHPDDRRASRFEGQLRDSLNRLLRMQGLSKKGNEQEGSTSKTARLRLAISTHERTTVSPTPIDHALWQAPDKARGRTNRVGGWNREWQLAPMYTQQLFDAISEHRRLTLTPRQPDQELWGLSAELRSGR